MIVHKSSSESDIDDASLALMVKNTTKMLKKLNKSGIKFDGKKKNSSQVAKESPYPKWIATIVVNLVI
jgi:aspartate oxidase